LAADVATGGVSPNVLDVWLNNLDILPRGSMPEVWKHLDISKFNFTNARWLVSHKKVRTCRYFQQA